MTDTTEIPLFPLSAVLLPHGRLSLRIFERRYLDLVRDCMHSDSGFGVVWILRGEEVARKGQATPELGEWGSYARIVDWDRLDDGLLGITIEGRQRFSLLRTRQTEHGLVIGEVVLEPPPQAVPMQPQWQSLLEVLDDLERHPQVQRMGLSIDRSDAWQVTYTLIQLLPLGEPLKYALLGLDDLPRLTGALDEIFNRIRREE